MLCAHQHHDGRPGNRVLPALCRQQNLLLPAAGALSELHGAARRRRQSDAVPAAVSVCAAAPASVRGDAEANRR